MAPALISPVLRTHSTQLTMRKWLQRCKSRIDWGRKRIGSSWAGESGSSGEKSLNYRHVVLDWGSRPVINAVVYRCRLSICWQAPLGPADSSALDVEVELRKIRVKFRQSWPSIIQRPRESRKLEFTRTFESFSFTGLQRKNKPVSQRGAQLVD